MTDDPTNDPGGPPPEPDADGRRPDDAPIEDLVRNTMEHVAVTVIPDRPPSDDVWASIQARRQEAPARTRPWAVITLLAAAAVILLAIGGASILRERSTSLDTIGPANSGVEVPAPTAPGTVATVAPTVPTSTTKPAPTTLPPTTAVPTTVAPTTTLAPDHIRSIDLDNIDVSTAPCTAAARGTMASPTARLKDGYAGVPTAAGGKMILSKYGVAFGDVTRDGIDDAVLLMNCGRDNSDQMSTSVALFSGAGPAPQYLGLLPASGAPLTATLDYPSDNGPQPTKVSLSERVVRVSVEGSTVVSTWSQAESFMGATMVPSLEVTVRHTWNGSSFESAGPPVIKVIPPQADTHQ